ncbi:DUF4142 domain-containing protein [Deinococcus aquatilis]|uniref:DUF4142 domain-containing protein n=1 Tax=Deinococcus aquatilis TaxID=519440 RepID=UPI0012F80450|nr:DUF4142 domain-containing protein [Deinococcus aquatilis]
MLRTLKAKHLIPLLVPAVLASCAPGMMATGPVMNATSIDGLFLQAATGSNLFEIQSSQVILTKSDSAAVKAYAQMLIDHHTAAQNQVATAAAPRAVPLPPALPPELQLKVNTLASLSAPALDQVYLQEQVLAHQVTLSLLQNEQTAGKDPGVVALAVDQVPVITQHLQEAQALLTSTAPPAPATPAPAAP